ncbi:MAG: hypothetical protein ACE5OQ_16690 [Woeseia sp.]
MRYILTYFPASILLVASSTMASDDLLNCRQLESDAARLQCYDEVADRLRTAAQSQQEVIREPREEVPGTQPETLFGKSTEETAEIVTEALGVEDIDRIEAMVSAVRRDPYDRLYIDLDNQQRWKQTGGGRFNLKAGEPILITRNFLGSYMLEKKSGGPRIRVDRIR